MLQNDIARIMAFLSIHTACNTSIELKLLVHLSCCCVKVRDWGRLRVVKGKYGTISKLREYSSCFICLYIVIYPA